MIDWERVELETDRVFESTSLAKEVGVNYRTVSKALKGKGIMRAKAMKIVKGLNLKDPARSYLYDEREGKSKVELKLGSSLKGWDLVEFSGGGSVRDIPYKIGKVRDKVQRYGRCKVFDLECLNQETIEIIDDELARNSNICHRVKRNNAIPLLYFSGFENKTTYWVVESWEEVTTLKELVSNDAIEFTDVPRIARDLATALLALNNSGVVVRCLTPDMVCLREDGSVLVRDFELSTFVELTNSRDLDKYKIIYFAPEFKDPHIDHRADMYSWAQIVIFCLIGRQPPSKQDPVFFANLPVRKPLVNILESCLSHEPNFRKWAIEGNKKKVFDFEDVLESLKDWV